MCENCWRINVSGNANPTVMHWWPPFQSGTIDNPAAVTATWHPQLCCCGHSLSCHDEAKSAAEATKGMTRGCAHCPCRRYHIRRFRTVQDCPPDTHAEPKE